MLIEIDDKIISTEIFNQKFVCDLQACKGACCIEGDAGAPLTSKEVEAISSNLNSILPYMTEEGIAAIENQGVSYLDEEEEPVTTLVKGKECAFVFRDQNGITKCSIEKAFLEKKIDFNKPISCHLYPIRVKKFGEYQALNFEKWNICEPACSCGNKLNVPVYRFLKEPLIRAFGQPFFEELELVEKELKD
jgi:hypothetical protein